jgi:ABC-2 type transport system permease protein
MRDFINVFKYTFAENARKKVFVVSTVIILIFVVALLNVPAVINYIDSNKKTDVQDQGDKSGAEDNKKIIYIIDSKKVLRGDLLKLSETYAEYEFKFETTDKLDTLKENVKSGKDSAIIVLDENSGIPKFDYFVKSYGSGLDPDTLSRSLQGIYGSMLLKDANVPENITDIALSTVPYNVNELGKGMMKSYFSALLVIMVIFFGVYFYGYGVATSVASEKTSRVMEILVTSTRPSRIILGKSAAMGALGLAQMLLIIIAAAITYKLSFPPDFTIAGQPVNFSNFTPDTIVFLVVYFILGYSLFATMNAVVGATVSKAEDVNSAIMPLNMLIIVAFYFAYAAVGLPEGPVARVASIIPFSAPFSMPTRILMSTVPAWEIAVSLVLLVVSIVIISLISIKLYSAAVLHYGKRLKINDLFKMSKQ